MRNLFTKTLGSSVVLWLGMSVSFATEVTAFTATWCGPCKAFKKALDENAEQLKDYEFNVIDIDKNRRLAREFKVKSVPTFIVLDNTGKEVARKIGYDNISELKTWLETHAADSSSGHRDRK